MRLFSFTFKPSHFKHLNFACGNKAVPNLQTSLLLLASAFPAATLAESPPSTAQTSPAASAKTESPTSPNFDIWEYQVVGNTVLPTGAIEKTVYPFLGPNRSIDDVEKAKQALQALYSQEGYQTVFVNIPEQDVKGGMVKLEVTEGKVERLKVTGSRYYALGHIRDSVPSLAEGQVPHLPSLQKQLTALSAEAADRQISPILRPGDRPGTFEAELKVNDKLPFHGSLEMNGRSSNGTSYSRLIATLRYDNLWQLNHSASLQYMVAPEQQDVEVWSGTYALPVFDTGFRLAFYGVGVESSSNVASASALGVLGTGNIFGLRLTKALQSSGGFFHSISLGIDYKHFNQGVLLLNSPVDNSPITYAPLAVGYSGGLRLDNSLTTFNMEGHFSIRGLGNQQEFENRRFLAQSNYFYFSGDLRHQHKLPADIGLMFRASGQVTGSHLINNEQYSAGGAYSVRGYHETEELGDSGVTGSMELHSPRLFPDEWEFTKDFRALAFVDGAKLWTHDPLPGSPGEVSLWSAGAGLRMEFWKRVLGELDWAYPFSRAGSVNAGNQRIHFRLAYEF